MEKTILDKYKELVTELFNRCGHPNPSEWLNENITQTNDQAWARFLVNERLRQILGSYELALGVNTRAERMCLINDGPEEEWAGLLQRTVIPSITEFRLQADRIAAGTQTPA